MSSVHAPPRSSPFPLAAGGATALAAALLAGWAPPLAAQQPERFTLQGRDVAVYNLAGVVRVEGGSGRDVSVEVTRRGPDAGRLEVRTGAVRGAETLRVIYPANRVVYPDLGRGSRTQLTVREDGTFGGRHGRGDRRVTITGGSDGLEASADLVVRVPRGQRVSVHLAVGEASVANVDGDLTVDVAAASVTARGTRGRLRLDTGSGEVEVADAEGELDLDVGSGGVRLANVRASRLVVDAGSGSLTGEGITATTLRLDLGSGGARLSRVSSGDIDLDSGSGEVELDLAGDVSKLSIDSGSGSVTLTVPPTLGATLDIDTGSGGIESDVPITVTRRSQSRLEGKIGDGEGRIRIESGSGEVRLRAARGGQR
jgi:hypothetical protein